MRRANFRFYLITDRTAVHNGSLQQACEAALSAAPPGMVALQLRDKDLPARERYRLALEMRVLCSRYGAPMLVNERVDIALAARADGVHLPADSIGVAAARRLGGPDFLVGLSTHSPGAVAEAAHEGADFAVFGPVFDPISKAAQGSAWGSAGLNAACRAASIPVYGLGGISPDSARELMRRADPDALPAGMAGIGSILQAAEPGEAMRLMLQAINLTPIA